MRVLVVDDREDARYLLEALLKGNGYEVQSVSNGAEALDRLKADGFDLIISDILMPVMDGFQLCRGVRKEEAFKHIPFIIYTATYTGPQDEAFALKIGADRFIIKPCEPETLMEAIRDVLAEAKRRRGAVVAEAPEQEAEIFKLYSERLVRKLEQKMLEAEREIKARREAEEALRIANNRLQMALKSSYVGLWDWDLQRNEVWFSPEWKAQIGYQDHEIANRYEEWEARLHPEDRPRVLAAATACLEGREGEYHVEFRLRHRDGSYRWINARGEIVPVSGAGRRFTGCHVDITPQKEMIQALDAERNKFRLLVDELPLGVALVDREGHFRYLNPRFTETFGYDMQDIVHHQGWLQKAMPDPPPRLDHPPPSARDSEANDISMMQDAAVKVRCKDGEEKQVRVRAVMLTGGNQMMTFEDVSEQMRMEERLRQAQKMEALATLAGGIAHDFNNILSAMLGFSELTLYELPSDSPAAANLAQVLTAGRRAKDLVKHILAFSRQTEQEPIPLSLHLIVKEALGLLRSTLPTTIEIRERSAPAGIIMGDPTQMHQVIMNLCTNAYHAMQEKGGVLQVDLRPVTVEKGDAEHARLDLTPGNYVRLTVSDTGCGMNPEVMARIFEPYFSTKAEGQGTGLGLAVVHGIVKSHGGTINVQSEPGKGAVFSVYLPQIERAVSGPEESPETPLLRGSERVLLVDDEPSLVSLGKQMLESLGYAVVTRNSGLEALKLFNENPTLFDLVITDMTMPHMTGDVLARELTRIRPDLPIILCTGFSHSVSEEKAKAMGIREYLMKPLMRQELARTVRKVLDRHAIDGNP